MAKPDYRRRVEGAIVCDKGREAWMLQQKCRHYERDSLSSDQCDWCVDGFCEYQEDVK